jgi:hypothetical protein
MTALELNCFVTYGMLVDVGHIKTYRPAFHKLEICIMRSYPIKSRALFVQLIKSGGVVIVEGSQVMKNSAASSACSSIGMTCGQIRS